MARSRPALQRVPGGRVQKLPGLRAGQHRRRVGIVLLSRPFDTADRAADRTADRGTHTADCAANWW